MFKYHVKKIIIPFLFLIDVFGYIIFPPFILFKKKLDNKNIKKILLIRLDHLGDVLTTTPVISAIRKKYPTAKIDIIIRSMNHDIIKNNKDINNIILFNPPWFSRGKHDSIKYFFNMIAKLRFEKYDVAIDFHCDPRNIILAWFVAKNQISFTIRGFSFLLTNPVLFYDQPKHIIERNFDLVADLGICYSSKYKMVLEINDLEVKNINKLIKKINLKKHKYIIIHPGAGRPNKLWFVDRWANLVTFLIDKYDVSVILTGSSSENKHISKIVDFSLRNNYLHKKFIFNFSGKTSSLELAYIIKNSALFISTDTGPMHIAKALNVPLVALFGSIDPIIWGYSDNHSICISKKIISYTCSGSICNNNESFKCMNAITIDDVIISVEKVLLK